MLSNIEDIPMVEPTERGQIAFARLKPAPDWPAKSVWDIYTIRANGTDLRQLTNDAKAYEFWFSPDGSQIAYIRRIYEGHTDYTQFGIHSFEEFTQKLIAGELPNLPNNVTHVFQLCVMNADGTNQRCLETVGVIDSALWLADGKRLVYSVDRGINYRDYVINADGSGNRLANAEDIPLVISQTRIRKEYQFIDHSVLSPDGSMLALIGRDKRGIAVLDVIKIENGESLQLEHAPNEYNSMIPAWSPDSEEIAFVATPVEDDYWDYKVPEALQIINVQTGQMLKLIDVDFGTDRRSEIYPYAPAWSPDGSRIMFIGLYDVEYWREDIYLINPDGSDLRRVTSDGLPKASLTWIGERRN